MGTALKKLTAVGRPFWLTWMRFARLLARVNTFLLMAFSFYVLVLPIGVIRRVSGRMLQHEGWVRREPLSPEHYRKQY
ncbi:MAG: hypothetical protein EHM23_31480 [Acidobacteria bacterium]|nr:MAG: hypothetical protein EHM23_31480 [Acidobacteriota bacterium]